MKLRMCLLLALVVASQVMAQSLPKSVGGTIAATSDPGAEIPTRTLEFKSQDLGSTVPLSPVTSFPPHCSSDGSLFIDSLDPNDLQKHTILSINGKEVRTYSPDAIKDLSDLRVIDFFPTDSFVGILVRATTESPGERGPGKSPAGIAWSKYHNYVAKFSRDGIYKGSVKLPVDYELSRLAIFPNGEMLISGFNRVNSVVEVLYLTSSGEIVRTLDPPAVQDSSVRAAPFGSGQAMTNASKVLGSVIFTSFKNDILVWRRNANDPILDVKIGGSSQEVPLQIPAGSVFVEMISSTDRWVAHFRSIATDENSRFNQTDYSYYELRPQDASLSSKLIQVGHVPLFLACESEGTYISYLRAQDKNFVLVKAE